MLPATATTRKSSPPQARSAPTDTDRSAFLPHWLLIALLAIIFLASLRQDHRVAAPKANAEAAAVVADDPQSVSSGEVTTPR